MQNPSKKIIALLGPTNTGKTHDAIEQMLEFDSGIFGLPLRLLAREVYEKRSAGMFEEVIQCAAVCMAWGEAYLNRNSIGEA